MLEASQPRRFRSVGLWLSVILAGLIAGCGRPARAQNTAIPPIVSPGDLKAVARTLKFVDSLPRNGVALGVLYSAQMAGGVEMAAKIGDELTRVAGGIGLPLQTSSIDVATLGVLPARLDALLILPGVVNSHAQVIAKTVRERHLISISTDPACNQAFCCMLFVQVEPRVEIVLNSELAAAVSARFSPIFAVMVTRK